MLPGESIEVRSTYRGRVRWAFPHRVVEDDGDRFALYLAPGTEGVSMGRDPDGRYLERWMSEQVGWRGFVRRLQDEAPTWAVAVPQLPRLLHHALAQHTTSAPAAGALALFEQRRRTNRLLALIAVLLAALVAVLALKLT